MPALPPTVRARRDYYVFRFRRDWPFYLSAFGASVGVLSTASALLPSALPALVVGAITTISFVVGMSTFRVDHAQYRAAARRLTVTDSVAPPPRPPLPRHLVDGGGLYVDHRTLGSAAICEPVDDALDHASLKVDWIAEPFELRDELRGTVVTVIRERLKDRQIAFNGDVVRLATDFTPAHLAAGEVVLQRASYFDGECSNELTTRRLSRDDERNSGFDFVDRFLTDAGGHLRELSQSQLANIVGVSTLAFTADPHPTLITVLQSERSGASRRLVAPSGSGSLELRDISAAIGRSRPATLREVVIAGMERELFEECNLEATTSRTSALTGFARWMARGAKPEFFGVTALGLGWDEIRARGIRRNERAFTQAVSSAQVDLAALAASADTDDLRELLGVSADMLDHASLPLLLALRALGRQLAVPGFMPELAGR